MHGREILADAKCYDTSSRCDRRLHARRRHHVPSRTLSQTTAKHAHEVAPTVADALEKGKVALIFGPEDHGLSNKDLEHCQLLVTIPIAPRLSIAATSPKPPSSVFTSSTSHR